MSLAAELVSKLREYLAGKIELDDFRTWFADVLRTANQHDGKTQDLIWSVGRTLAKFGSGQLSSMSLRGQLWGVIESQRPQPVQQSASPSQYQTVGISDLLFSPVFYPGLRGQYEYVYTTALPPHGFQVFPFPWNSSGPIHLSLPESVLSVSSAPIEILTVENLAAA